MVGRMVQKFGWRARALYIDGRPINRSDGVRTARLNSIVDESTPECVLKILRDQAGLDGDRAIDRVDYPKTRNGGERNE
jgi:hypothetical protein